MKKALKLIVLVLLVFCMGNVVTSNLFVSAENNYTISYVLDGGVNNNQNPDGYNGDSDINILAPTKSGYKFEGWYTADNTPVTIISSTDTTNYVLYAKWSIVEYTITYILDGGVNNNQNPSGYTVNSSDITLHEPTKSGYKFVKWVNNDETISVIEKGSLGDLSLTAIWTLDEYTIKYNLAGGSNNSGNPSSYNVDSNITLNAPTKSGSRFLGWYLDSNYSTLTNSINGISGDITLYAKWGECTLISSDADVSLTTPSFFLDGTSLVGTKLEESYLKNLNLSHIYSKWTIQDNFKLSINYNDTNVVLDEAVTVRIDVSSTLLNDDTLCLVAIDNNGNAKLVDASIVDGSFEFSTSYLESYLVVTKSIALDAKTYPVLTKVGYFVSLGLLAIFIGLSIWYYFLNKKLNRLYLKSAVLPLVVLMSYVERGAIVSMTLLGFGIIVMLIMNISLIVQIKNKKKNK